MTFRVGQQVRVQGRLRRLVRRVNTFGGWQLDREVEGFLFWNEDEMVQSMRQPVKPKRGKRS